MDLRIWSYKDVLLCIWPLIYNQVNSHAPSSSAKHNVHPLPVPQLFSSHNIHVHNIHVHHCLWNIFPHLGLTFIQKLFIVAVPGLLGQTVEQDVSSVVALKTLKENNRKHSVNKTKNIKLHNVHLADLFAHNFSTFLDLNNLFFTANFSLLNLDVNFFKTSILWIC